MQSKQKQIMVELYFSTIHYHVKMLNIKLGTICALKDLVNVNDQSMLIVMSPSIILLRTSCGISLFFMPRQSSNPHSRLVLRLASFFLPFFWCLWGSKSPQTRRSTPPGLSLFASTSIQWIVSHVLRLVSVPLMKSTLARAWLWMTRHVWDLFQGFVKWR